jgi:DNA polymerase-3 subunit alpha
MSKYFTHLHTHTEFSLLDGATSLDKLIDFAKKEQIPAIAITDHGNVFGAVKFFEKCKSAKIKPIIGIEMYFTEDAKIKSSDNKYYHLILLVKNKTGYENLCKLISFAYQDGFYFKPRIDYEILEKYSEGLIVTTACLGGHIPKLLMQENYQEANHRIDWFLRVFGPENFYFEVQPEDQEEQVILNQRLFEWGARKGVQVVATCDSHYSSLEDHEAHEVMLTIQTRKKFDDPTRFTFGKCRAYLRTQAEMLEIFKDHEQAVWNSGKIADMCNFEFETGKLFFPDFAIPANHTPESFFKELCQTGLENLITNQRILNEDRALYQARLDLEVDLIVKMGFIGYFLVVSDFIRWSKRNQIPVGPGRGSAAGSLVAWALEITNIDPIKYNLLFERFLNPERITMPDIDIDFCIEGRERVIQYVKDKYGHDKVCQIITFGTMMAKGVIKDVARTLDLPFEDANAITNLIPDQLKITLKEALEKEPKLTELIDANPKVRKIFEIAKKLEGITRHASKHAAGIVISPQRIDHMLPIYIPPKTNELVTQYAMTELETIGFLKIDMLGLKNLTLVDKVVCEIKKNHHTDIDIDKIPLNDAKTFAIICAGKTSGVFQLESDGLKEVLRKLQPDKFEDIIAVNALYRPGPLGSGMVDDYIERRHGRQKISYLFPELESILQETYGVIVYQEQVIKIASSIGGYSLGEADILRRAMGKKKAEVMIEQKNIFMQKAVQKGFDAKKAEELFDLMAYFAGYGFNKSHSAAYAMIAYQTAYLKANYPAEFMASLISLEASHPEKMSFYLSEVKELGISLLAPDINASQIDFSVVNNSILFGLIGIKNVGLTALQAISSERSKKPFKDLLDFCKRVDLRVVNKRVIENLICAGAFDQQFGNRAQKFEALSNLIDVAIEHKQAMTTGQMGLFGSQKTNANQDDYALPNIADWDIKTKLAKESEVMGFYLSAHPLDSYLCYIKWLKINSFQTIIEQYANQSSNQEPIVMGLGLKKSLRTITTKKGDPMAFMQIEDLSSNAEVIIFPKQYRNIANILQEHDAFIVQGNLDLTSATKCKIKALQVIPVEQFFEYWPEFKKLVITINQQNLEQLIANLEKNKGKTPVQIKFQENHKTLLIQTKYKVNPSLELMQQTTSLSQAAELIV